MEEDANRLIDGGGDAETLPRETLDDMIREVGVSVWCTAVGTLESVPEIPVFFDPENTYIVLKQSNVNEEVFYWLGAEANAMAVTYTMAAAQQLAQHVSNAHRHCVIARRELQHHESQHFHTFVRSLTRIHLPGAPPASWGAWIASWF